MATKRKRSNHEDYFHASEIAARLLYDKYGVGIDRAFCDPKYRQEFDRIAESVAPDVSAYLLRKAALKLRKNRQLKPELIPRIASWGQDILDFPADEVTQNLELIPRQPGIYIFRDRSGYLYIGESEDLYLRIKKHLDHSDRKSLARYFWENGFKHITLELHVFDPVSNARFRAHRRAYESSLIESRRPKLNLQP
ncbi:MAG: GIY-YIG nuclease family protein [Planctomycetota bacterium]